MRCRRCVFAAKINWIIIYFQRLPIDQSERRRGMLTRHHFAPLPGTPQWPAPPPSTWPISEYLAAAFLQFFKRPLTAFGRPQSADRHRTLFLFSFFFFFFLTSTGTRLPDVEKLPISPVLDYWYSITCFNKLFYTVANRVPVLDYLF